MQVARLLLIFALVGSFAGPLAAGAQTPAPADAAPPAAATAPAPPDSASPMMHGRHGHRHRQSLIHALRAVNLTPAQKEQIATFRDQERKANVNADAATKQTNAAKMRQQIMGILTPDQKAQLSAQMHRSGTHMPGAGPVPTPAMSPGSK